MPLQINVGLSRKASADFQSNGASINIVAELDQRLLAHPDELQRSIDNLYAQARCALDRQAKTPMPAPATPRHDPPANGHNGRNGDRFASGNGDGGSPRPMSEKQKAAILAIARKSEIDPYASCRQTFGIELQQLASWQAAKLIDSLKA